MKTYFCLVPSYLLLISTALFLLISGNSRAQVTNQSVTKQQVQQLVEKKAEYHRLTNGVRDGYRIKIHFGIERETAREIRAKFNSEYPDLKTYEEYQQPNFVVLVGDFRSKLEAFQMLKRIQLSFPNAFIVQAKINTK